MGKAHAFGGHWTAEKLEVIAAYLKSYTTALQGKPSADRRFRLHYIDAFAGTGYRDPDRSAHGAEGRTLSLLPDFEHEEPRGLLDGSARLALKTTPRFDRYVFIEKSPKRCIELEALKIEHPELAVDIEIHQGDANVNLRAICDTDWTGKRAVLFLDPYGMQVEWTTIEAIAATKAIDMWLLFPLGQGVNRMLTRSGDMPISWRNKLDAFLGTREWEDEFYKVERSPTLFGDESEHVVKATTQTIGRYFNKRLSSVFSGVAPNPRVLSNSANCPLYLLCFAVGNPRGTPIALRIARHLLEKGAR